jgi:hypothetical protein
VEFGEALGQDGVGDAAHVAAQLGEARCAVGQRAQDDAVPSLAEELEGACEGLVTWFGG